MTTLESRLTLVPRSRELHCAGHRIHFLEWGDPNHDTVLIWHGVAGNAAEGELLARHLATEYHVLCPDSIGCGKSEWPQDPTRDMVMASQCEVAQSLLEQLGVDRVRWIGASRGGSLGIYACSHITGIDITHLVINDSAPQLPEKFRLALARNLQTLPEADSLEGFEKLLRAGLSRDHLQLNDAEWRWLARIWSRRTEKDTYTYHHTPELWNMLIYDPRDYELWDCYEQITASTLLIRGEKTKMMTDNDVKRMQTTGARCRVINRPGGHVSLYQTALEQNAIAGFLR
jgi:pimeloyl-ACP methyl ester carboxylesterase